MSTPSIRPYRVRNSGWSIQRVYDWINKASFNGRGTMPSMGTLRAIVNPVHAFERFMSRLAGIPNVEVVTFREAFTRARPSDKIRVVIRHDLDNDAVAAERHARIERDLNIPTTYFIRHTSGYHGTFDHEEGIFYRNECMRHYYAALQEMGHEVALHNDALAVYQQWLTDGAQALREELDWLRSCGLEVCGSVAHNHVGVYGAENFEIFKNSRYVDWHPTEPGDYKNENETCCKGRKAPLRILDPNDLGLTYEGNDLTQQSNSPVVYGSTRFVNHWYWTLQIQRPNGSSFWQRVESQLQTLMGRVSDARGAPVVGDFVDEDTLLQDLSTLPAGALVVLCIHPVYYGCRYSIDKGPPRIRSRVTLQINEDLGWQTYTPGQVQCCFDTVPDGDARQSIGWANELGMLDKPWDRYQGKADLKILMLGSDTLDARRVMGNAQCHALLEWFFRETFDRKVFVYKLAFARMGVDRLWSWYQKVNESWKTDITILGIDGDTLGKNLPQIWSQRTGFSAKYPPGDYLGWDPDEEKFRMYPRSRAWRIRQRAPKEVWAWPYGGQDLVQTVLEGTGFQVDGCDCLEYLDRLYGFVLDEMRKDGATPVLLLEGLGTYPSGENGRVAIEPASELGKRMRGRLAEFAQRHGVDLIDPYGTFDAAPCHRRPIHRDGTWTYAGHRMAAESLFERLLDLAVVREHLASS